MSDWLKVWTPEDVQNVKGVGERSKAFASYAQQRLGVPYPTNSDLVLLRKKAKELFAQYPSADWRTLCKIVEFCKARKKRPSRVWMVVDLHREAWAAGRAPELDFNYIPPAPEVDEELTAALQQETHPWWRRRMVMAQGLDDKRKVLLEWRTQSSLISQ